MDDCINWQNVKFFVYSEHQIHFVHDGFSLQTADKYYQSRILHSVQKLLCIFCFNDFLIVL